MCQGELPRLAAMSGGSGRKAIVPNQFFIEACIVVYIDCTAHNPDNDSCDAICWLSHQIDHLPCPSLSTIPISHFEILQRIMNVFYFEALQSRPFSG